MKFTVDLADLLPALQLVVRAAPKQTPIPILSNVLLSTVEDGCLSLTCYDQEVGIRVRIPAQVEEGDEITVPARLLTDVVSDLPDADIRFEDGAPNLSVLCGKSHFTLSTLPASDFPLLPGVSEADQVMIPASMMREIIKQTLFAVAEDESRPTLAGVCFTFAKRDLCAVSTDVHRMCIKRTPAADAITDLQVILPTRALEHLSKCLPVDADEPVEMRLSSNQALFRWKGITIVSRLIEGQYANYERVIPTSSKSHLIANRKEFLAAVHRVAIVARMDKTGKVILRAAGGGMALTAQSEYLSKAFDEIAVEQEGDNIEIAFNCDYLLDGLTAIPSEQVRMEFTGALAPCILRAAGLSDYQYIIMPQQIKE